MTPEEAFAEAQRRFGSDAWVSEDYLKRWTAPLQQDKPSPRTSGAGLRHVGIGTHLGYMMLLGSGRTFQEALALADERWKVLNGGDTV